MPYPISTYLVIAPRDSAVQPSLIDRRREWLRRQAEDGWLLFSGTSEKEEPDGSVEEILIVRSSHSGLMRGLEDDPYLAARHITRVEVRRVTVDTQLWV